MDSVDPLTQIPGPAPTESEEDIRRSRPSSATLGKAIVFVCLCLNLSRSFLVFFF